MSNAVHDARQRLVDEMLVELQELSDRRSDLLREMFHLVQYGETNNSSALLGDEDVDEGVLERFLDRFDLQKNLHTGSILNLEIPDLKLEALPPRRLSSPRGGEEEAVLEAAPQSYDLKYPDGEEDLQYPSTSPVSSRSHLPKTTNEGHVQEDQAMDVDVPEKIDQPAAAEGREETPVNIVDEDEDEQQAEEQRTPPRTRARTRTASPIVSKRRKRRRSDISDENEPAEDAETLQVPSGDIRQTRSKSRKVTPPPPIVTAEDEDVDELDIISLSSPTNISPPRQRDSPEQLRPQSVQPEETISAEDATKKEQNEPQVESEEGPLKSMQLEEEKLNVEEQFVPPSPSTPSLHTPSKSPSTQFAAPEPRESPIRAPKPKEPYIIDMTPLTPPRSPPPPVIIRLPIHQPEKPIYHFLDESKLLEPEIKIENEPTLPPAQPDRPRPPPAELRFAKRLAFAYTLPPLSALPPEFNRKGKPAKSRKRDKERERSGSDAGRKDDWVPLGMAKWAASLMANPAYKKLGRATKCVNSKDWNTASTELKLMRTLERIDVLKRMGKWSFRQLKKQRVTAGLVKTHWDYLMDEMKWMQVDFREERRWKSALAYELALAVQEWHEAGSQEERIRLGICARWRRPDPLDMIPMEEDQRMEVDLAPPPASEDEEHDGFNLEEAQLKKCHADISASDNEDEEVEDQRAVTAALIPDNIVVESAEDSHQAFTVPDPPEATTVTMKQEEIEGEDILHLAEGANITDINSSDRTQDTTNPSEELPKSEGVDVSQALKENSNNPVMGSQPAESTPAEETVQPEQGSSLMPNQTKLLRSSILSLPEETLAISLDQLSLSDEDLMKSLAPTEDANATIGLTMVFPELQPFSMIDVPNSETNGSNSEGRKKNDKKADKDDPTKRVEETTYTKLCPTSRFMHVKPTLVSALQPAKKWRKGKWIDLDESPVVSDVDSPSSSSSPPENSCTLFEGRKLPILHQPPLVIHSFSKLPRNSVKTQEIPWSQAEDNLLKSLGKRYPSNWRLVADALNSSRIRTSIDLRTPQECFERYRLTRPNHSAHVQTVQHTAQFADNEEGASSNMASVDGPPPPSTGASMGTSQMTTRGIKRLATTAAQNALNLTIHTGAPTVEMRKRKRHQIIYESVRKTLARRTKQRRQDELKYQANASVVPVHETHNQLAVKARYTPAQLSQMKADRERKEMELQIIRRREFEAKRQQQQQQQQQLQAQLQQAQQQQQMGQQGVSLSQNVPQIRTQIMQQQAAQQARALAQAQAQVQQAQPNHSQLQGQMANAQPSMNGAVPHLSPQYVNRGGANSPVAQHSSPPRTSVTPVNSVGTFPRPSSAQRNLAMQGTQVLPMTGGSVPIARTNNTLASYFANSGLQYTPEQMSHLMRYQAAQQVQQQLQMQQPQQQQVQMQMQAGQQNAHQGSMTGYPSTGS